MWRVELGTSINILSKTQKREAPEVSVLYKWSLVTVQITEKLSRQKYSKYCQTFKMECRCGNRNFQGQKRVGGVLWNQGTSIKILSKTPEKRAFREPFWSFSPRYYQNYILNRKFNEHNQGFSFENRNTSFLFSKRAEETSFLLPSCAPCDSS